MDVELLFIDGCPNWREELDELRQILRTHGQPDEVSLVKVASREDAERLRFAGSPTVRVDGRDVDPNPPQTGFNIECRIYWVEGRAVRRPPHAWVIEALRNSENR